MSDFVDVSVVMAVFNGSKTLQSSLDSILSQDGVHFELIVVDDGSTDETGEILVQTAARDPRVRVFAQPNAGLTRALIHGCNQARGRFIARQDCGDRSLPGRLAAQATLLNARSSVVMTSCGTRFVAPEGEIMSETFHIGKELHEGLQQDDSRKLRGPSHHGSTMFRQDAYRAVGGYREAFGVAQDIDLWVRLTEVGLCWGSPEIGYEAVWDIGSISQRYVHRQTMALEMIADSRRMRLRCGDDGAIIRRMHALDWGRLKGDPSPAGEGYYFLGACMRKSNPQAACKYFRAAIAQQPLKWVAWIRLLQTLPAVALERMQRKKRSVTQHSRAGK